MVERVLEVSKGELLVGLRCGGGAGRTGGGELRTLHLTHAYSQSWHSMNVNSQRKHFIYVHRESRLIMTMGRQAGALVAKGVRWSLTPERAAM